MASRHFGPAVLIGVGAVALVAVVALSFSRRGDDQLTSVRQSVIDYQERLHALASQAGQVVVEGVQAGIADVESGSLAPADFRTRATGWKAQLEDVRTRAAALTPPDDLARAAALFDAAMRGYERAVDGFAAATEQPPASVTAAIQAAMPTAKLADTTYDQAEHLIVAELQRVGAPTPTPLP